MKNRDEFRKTGSAVPKARAEGLQRCADLRAQRRMYLEAISAGMPYKEAMALMGLRYGVISNWKRWDAEFRQALNDAAKEGVPKRKELKWLDCMIHRYGPNFQPGPESKALLDARARARVPADGRARGLIAGSSDTSIA